MSYLSDEDIEYRRTFDDKIETEEVMEGDYNNNDSDDFDEDSEEESVENDNTVEDKKSEKTTFFYSDNVREENDDDDLLSKEEESSAKNRKSSNNSISSKSTNASKEKTSKKTKLAKATTTKKKKKGPTNSAASTAQPAVKVLVLPFRAIKRIMKIDTDVGTVQNEAAVLLTYASELFLKKFAQESHAFARKKGRNTIRYEDVAEARVGNDPYAFLQPMLP